MIYLNKRDIKGRPIIIICPYKIDFSIVKKVDVFNALIRCFLIVREYMLFEGFIDNWKIIIDGDY